jgi:hypothetical protein
MPTTDAPHAEDELGTALSDVVEFLALTDMVGGKLTVVASPMNKVIAALLIGQERHAELSPYRRYLQARIRAVTAGPDPGHTPT